MKIRYALMAFALAAQLGAAHAGDSMFDEKKYQALVADQKAFKVGDALTVLIQESASASSSVDAKANRSQDIGLRGQTLGQQARGLSAGTTSTSDGGGQVVRSGRVTAQITVTVTEIQANGEMLVNGQQTVDLNGESQIIAVAGRVRPRDISDSNSVLSSRLAEPRITYSGQGYMADKSQPSIWARFITWIGL
ncbi:MAG: flagellar basal body L-ring protein FlgH [Aquabacterium sp.]